MFASGILKRRIEGMKFSRWKRHLEEIFVKINGDRHYRGSVQGPPIFLKLVNKVLL